MSDRPPLPVGPRAGKCLLVSNDLMFGVQAAQAAQEAGYQVLALRDFAALLDESLDGVQLILVDLNLPQFDAQSVVDHLQVAAAARPDLVAVGPHVHHGRLEAARQAGWRVCTRGQFHADARRILAGPAASSES